jgi:hypothetical protein
MPLGPGASSPPQFRPCLDSRIYPKILLCKKKILHQIKMPAHIWSTKCR